MKVEWDHLPIEAVVTVEILRIWISLLILLLLLLFILFIVSLSFEIVLSQTGTRGDLQEMRFRVERISRGRI